MAPTPVRLRLLLAGALVLAGPFASAAQPVDPYADVLDLRGTPAKAGDRGFNIFFDAGAWHGYSLPAVGDAGSGFSGPFVHSVGPGRWAGRRFARVVLKDAGGGDAIMLREVASRAAPGYLERRFEGDGLALRQTLFFADARRALVRIELVADAARTLAVAVEGEPILADGDRLAPDSGAWVQTFADSRERLRTRLQGDAGDLRATRDARGYRFAADAPLRLQAGQPLTLVLEQALLPAAQAAPADVDADAAWQANRARWDGYLRAVASAHVDGVPDETARRIAVKAVETLIGNWRSARGDLRHDGVIPSYSADYFNGFWAWDSWKHAAALAHVAPDLARDQMRAMFDFQSANGMVADSVYLDAKENNWRNTKPPLAAWATLEIHRATGDAAFVAELYDKLVRYHRWWFAERDHDRNGLAEFGATDGTRIAAAWESGMDNAVRFDGAKMLANGKGAWSLDQESVDLNAYLYREKLDLAELADVLGKRDEAAAWRRDAEAMKARIGNRFFDAAAGWFFDARLGSGEHVRVFGSEGWTPLWAGIASEVEARGVIATMLDPKRFATPMPLPTLAADDPRFSPVKGYWRGPLWLDQARFGVEALRRYGHAADADALTARLLLQADGLDAQAPMYENYDPTTGKGYQARNFSWSAASYLWLLGIGR
ncbi:glycoside hydrolase [Thermomonas brevis]|uniref:Glycoside hydrolase n=1 Tax=Thermomonas brevis TaxID=215691 RepID=A0A7G9QPN6_9GAMM|nr:trehalase family glycosidase [Thermomonas brevis]QNN45311.1 glycoside hydrolase [Thermomonas brevis]